MNKSKRMSNKVGPLNVKIATRLTHYINTTFPLVFASCLHFRRAGVGGLVVETFSLSGLERCVKEVIVRDKLPITVNDFCLDAYKTLLSDKFNIGAGFEGKEASVLSDFVVAFRMSAKNLLDRYNLPKIHRINSYVEHHFVP